MLNNFVYKVPVFELMAFSYKIRCLLRMALQCQPIWAASEISTVCVRVSSRDADISRWRKRTETHAR